jgi:hypothetical protein
MLFQKRNILLNALFQVLESTLSEVSHQGHTGEKQCDLRLIYHQILHESCHESNIFSVV